MKFLFSFLVVSFLCLSSHAAILEVAKQNATPQVLKFVSDIESKLPKAMKDNLSKKNKKIIVRFEVLKNDSNQIQIPKCDNIVDSFLEADSVTAEYKTAQNVLKSDTVRYNKQIYSYVGRDKAVVMNAGFLPIITAGEYSARTYNCEHKNLYRLAEASVINGIASIYDNGISSSTKYALIAGWNKKQKRMQGFWPRAVNPFEYAGTPANHFATNMEFFVLDPEYACRRPLMQDFFVRTFGEDPLAGKRTCSVNYVLKIPFKDALDRAEVVTEETYESVLRSYDLNPDRIFNINYLRAGAGTGAGSFGHAMFKISSCSPGQPLSSECTKENYSLVVNPRANPLEMRLDTMKGIFGGYPSQFFVSPLREIRDEYGQQELRHLYSVPLTGSTVTDPATGQQMQVMPADQKKRLIYATLDQYWTYYGKYKFLSNNCADETMRLYQMSSDDPQVLDLNVLMPQDFNKKLSKLGLADEAKTKGLEPASNIFKKLIGSLLKKDMKWSDFEKNYNESYAVGSNTTYLSYNYDIMKSVRTIMMLEGRSEKECNSLKAITNESKKWVALALPQVDLKDKKDSTETKNDIFGNFQTIKVRYANLMNRTADINQKYQIALSFYRIIYLIIEKRSADMGSDAVAIAYSIAYPRDSKEYSDLKIGLKEMEIIKKAVDDYSKVEQSLMPYTQLSVMPGYGIPLANEVTRDREYVMQLDAENKLIRNIISSLTSYLSAALFPDKLIMTELEQFKKQIVADKLAIQGGNIQKH